MNADKVLARLEKLRATQLLAHDSSGQPYPYRNTIYVTDLDAAIAEIRVMLPEDFVSYADGIVTIGGTRYTKELLQAWGENGMPVGECFRIIRREDGVVGFERLGKRPPEVYCKCGECVPVPRHDPRCMCLYCDGGDNADLYV